MSARPARSPKPKPKPKAAAQHRPLRLVRRRSRSLIKRSQGRRFAPIAIVTVIAAGAIVFGVLLEQVVLAQSAFKVTKIRQDVAAAEALHQELLLEAARLESPGRIERVAKTKLAMVEAASVEYIVADIGRSKRGRRVPGGAVARGFPAVEDAAALGSSYAPGAP